MTGLSNAKPDTSVICNYSLTLDGVGNHTQSTQNEPLLPLVPNQNTSYVYDSDNRLTSFTGTSNTYDANGNLTGKGPDTFAYDFENRLTQSVIGGATSQYQYDGIGNRKTQIAGGLTKRFVQDTSGSLSRMLAETDGAGAITAYYVYGRGLISRIAANGTPAYYHYDVRGSTIALSDTTGNLTDEYAFDPFGKIANSQGTTANPFKYVGKYGVMDESNGLTYIRARYFSPDLGRFITKDPLAGTDADGQSLHRYVYALNNPVRLVDVSGFSSHEVTSVAQAFSGSSDKGHDFIFDLAAKGTRSLANTLVKKAFEKYLVDNVLVDYLLKRGASGKYVGQVTGFVNAGSVLTGIVKDGAAEIASRGDLGDALRNLPQNIAYGFHNPDAFLGALKDGVDSTTAVTVNALSGELTGGYVDPGFTGRDISNGVDAYVNGVYKLEDVGGQAIDRGIDSLGTLLYQHGLYFR